MVTLKCVAAFDLCIAIMDRGEKCELVSDAQYAYGQLGRYTIRLSAVFQFNLNLVSFATVILVRVVAPICDGYIF